MLLLALSIHRVESYSFSDLHSEIIETSELSVDMLCNEISRPIYIINSMLSPLILIGTNNYACT